MSDKSQAVKNKKQKHPKVNFSQYIFSSEEPNSRDAFILPAGLQAELIDNSFSMRRQFRHIAFKMRNRYL